VKLVTATALLVLSVAGAAAGAAGSPQSTIVFTADQAPKVAGDIFRLDANGRSVNLTHTPFVESIPAVAPRGGHVAYVSERDGRTSVWVTGLDASGARRVTPWAVLSGSTGQLAWAPDGKRLVAVLGDTLYLAQPGVAPRAIAYGEVLGDPAWSPDGTLVTFATGAYPSSFTEAVTPEGHVVWRVHQTGGLGGWSSRGLYVAPRDGTATVYSTAGRPLFRFAARLVSWSPDGRRLASTSVSGKRVEVRDTSGRLVFTHALPSDEGLVWFGNGALVTGSTRIDIATGRATTVSPFIWLYGSGGAYPVADGREFALRVGSRTFGRVAGCMSDGARVPAISNLQAVPGGRSLVYASACWEPFANLYSVSPAGGPTKRLTDVAQQQGSVVASPDGTQIASTGAPATGLSCKGCPQTIWIANANGTHPRALTHEQDCAFDGSPAWSSDAKSIFFVRSTCDSPGELMSVPVAGGTPIDLHERPAEAAWGPETSRDGRVAAARGRNGVTISVNGSQEHLVLPFAQVVSLAWSPDGSRFVVAARPKGGATFDVYTLHTDDTGVRRLTTDMDALSVSWF